MRKQNLTQNGESSDVETERPLGTLSTSAVLTQQPASPPISVMLDTTPRQKQGSPLTPKSVGTPNSNYASLIHALAVKLGTLVEWRKVELKDGRHGYALYFDSAKWLVDPETKELTPTGG